jgi:hypothetical protein
MRKRGSLYRNSICLPSKLKEYVSWKLVRRFLVKTLLLMTSIMTLNTTAFVFET